MHDDATPSTTPCYCPRCGEDHQCPESAGQRLEDGRVIADCTGCLVQRVFEQRRNDDKIQGG